MGTKKICKTVKKLNKDNYKIKTWNQKYKDGEKKVKLLKLVKNKKWKKIFKTDKFEKELSTLDKFYNMIFKKNPKKKINIFPYPKLIFSAFNCLNPDDIKIVLLGQDPYHGCEFIESGENKQMIPQAMGLSFSVPIGVNAGSLKNIFDNLIKYKHLKKTPKHGNLYNWAEQGILLLNMALTVEKAQAGEHLSEWKAFTDLVISYLSKNCKNLVFLIWGSHSLKKVTEGLIDKKKHKVLISSHPSGYSYTNKLGDHPAFRDLDHFGEANKYLKKHGKEPIVF